MSLQEAGEKGRSSTTTSARSATARTSRQRVSKRSKSDQREPKRAGRKKQGTITTDQHLEILGAVISDMRSAGSLPAHGWVIVGWAPELNGDDAEVIAMFNNGSIRIPGELVAGAPTGKGG